MMHHVKKNAAFFKECSGKDKKVMNEIMAHFHAAKRAEIGSDEVKQEAHKFAQLATEANFDFVLACY
jgi:hypothetical protein